MEGNTFLPLSIHFCAQRGKDSATVRTESPACVSFTPAMAARFHGFDGSVEHAHFIDRTMVSKATKLRRQTQQHRASSQGRGPDGRFLSSTPGGVAALADDDPASSTPPRTYSTVAAATPVVASPGLQASTSVPQSTLAPTPAKSHSSSTLSTPSGTPTVLDGSSVLALTTFTPKSRATDGSGNAASGPTSDPDAGVEDASLSQSSFPRRFFTAEDIASMRKAEEDIKAALNDTSQVDLHRDLQAIMDEHDSEVMNGSADISPPVAEINFNGFTMLMDRLREDKKAMQAMMDSMSSMAYAFEERGRFWETMDTCIQRKVERVQEMLDVDHIRELVAAPVRREVIELMSSRTEEEASGFRSSLESLRTEMGTIEAAIDQHKVAMFVIKDENEAGFRSMVSTLRGEALDLLASFRDDINAQLIATGQAHLERIKNMTGVHPSAKTHSSSTPFTTGSVEVGDSDSVSVPAEAEAPQCSVPAEMEAPQRFDHRGYPLTSRGGIPNPSTCSPSTSHVPTRANGSRGGHHSVSFVETDPVERSSGWCGVSGRRLPSQYDGAEVHVLGEGSSSTSRWKPSYDHGAEDGSVLGDGFSKGDPRPVFSSPSRHDHHQGPLDYHGGMEGLRDDEFLTGFYLRQLGFTNHGSFSEMARLHRTIRQTWFHKSNNTYGPQRESILNSKALQKLALSRFDARSVVSWYERLVTTCEAYRIALMPFDAIQFQRGSEGLCLPGLGTDRHTDMASALCSVLQVCLVNASTRVLTMAATVESRTRNGYDILWRFLRLYVPGFDPSKLVERPSWGAMDGDVITFATAFDLYFRLTEKNGHYHSDVVKSTLFLKGITEPAMMKVVEPLLIAVESAASASAGVGTLPRRLCFDELAVKISERMVVEPTDSRVLALTGALPPPTSVLSLGGATEPDDEDDSGPQLFAVSQGGRSNSEGSRKSGFDRSAGRLPSGLTRRPDPTNRIRSPVADSICEACGKRGHIASTCDYLAMSVFTRKFIRQGKLTEDLARDLEKRWLDRWSTKGGKPHTTPSKVYAAVSEMYGLSLDQLDAGIDWRCWPLDVDGDE